MDCETVDGGRHREVLHWRYHGVLPRYHHGDPVRQPGNSRAGVVAVGKKGPAVDENILQVRGEAAMLPQRMLSS